MNGLAQYLFTGMGIWTIIGVILGILFLIDTLRTPDFRNWKVITSINRSENVITYKDIKTGSTSKKMIK
ncbi:MULTISPECIES: hypothetical protein [Clostridium]|uniref:Uncharacterized protein n=1 Tax=Clostridium lapidicellarium TaxID=3240931 RepID=A0ABV4DXQ9_9CLOT